MVTWYCITINYIRVKLGGGGGAYLKVGHVCRSIIVTPFTGI